MVFILNSLNYQLVEPIKSLGIPLIGSMWDTIKITFSRGIHEERVYPQICG